MKRLMIDPKKAAKLIRQHFSDLTTEQFVENLHRSCPEVFEDSQRSHDAYFDVWHRAKN